MTWNIFSNSAMRFRSTASTALRTVFDVRAQSRTAPVPLRIVFSFVHPEVRDGPIGGQTITAVLVEHALKGYIARLRPFVKERLQQVCPIFKEPIEAAATRGESLGELIDFHPRSAFFDQRLTGHTVQLLLFRQL
jgi:hypothetical protein